MDFVASIFTGSFGAFLVNWSWLVTPVLGIVWAVWYSRRMEAAREVGGAESTDALRGLRSEARAVLVVGVLLTGVAIGAGLVEASVQKITIDDIKTMQAWRTTDDWNLKDGTGGLKVETEGRFFVDYVRTHRLGAIAFHYDTTVPIEDHKNLQKSELKKITRERIVLKIPPSGEYLAAVKSGTRRTAYMLVLVPNDIEMEHWDTLRQAEFMGVEVAGQATGPP